MTHAIEGVASPVPLWSTGHGSQSPAVFWLKQAAPWFPSLPCAPALTITPQGPFQQPSLEVVSETLHHHPESSSSTAATGKLIAVKWEPLAWFYSRRPDWASSFRSLTTSSGSCWRDPLVQVCICQLEPGMWAKHQQLEAGLWCASSPARGGNTGCWVFFVFVFLFYQKPIFVHYEIQVRSWTSKDFNICPCGIKSWAFSKLQVSSGVLSQPCPQMTEVTTHLHRVAGTGFHLHNDVTK